MNLTQLACFKCFVEEKSMTKAAQRLHVTQPAVSHQVRLLAEGLECRLYHRRGNHIELTPDGEFVYEKAKGILWEVDGLRDELRSRSGRVCGRLRLGSGQVAAKTVLRDAVHGMMQDYPDMSFSLFETSSSSLSDLLLQSRIDLGVGILPQNNPSIRTQKLVTGRMLLVCSERNPLSARKSISRRDLRQLDLIRHSRENTARSIVAGLYGEEEVRGTFSLEAMNSETVLSYVQSDMGVALATSLIIEWLRPAGIATIEIEDGIEIPWGIMSDASRSMSKAATTFVDKLTELFPPQNAANSKRNARRRNRLSRAARS